MIKKIYVEQFQENIKTQLSLIHIVKSVLKVNYSETPVDVS